MRVLIAIAGMLTSCSLARASETDTLVCNYEKYATSGGVEKVREPFVLTYIIDAQNNAAYLVGNRGSSKVQALYGDNGITFIEITPIGNVMTTTVDSKGMSVHSRHTLIQGELVPSQYYGACQYR